MPPHWIVDVTVGAAVALPSGERLDRESFYAWLWEEAVGLVGIDEGTLTVEEAARHGLAPAIVIDAAAAPADRDWIARLATATAACWFADEEAARDAARLLAAAAGCRVVRIRADDSEAAVTAWRDAFGPVTVPGFGVVRPAWEPGEAGDGPDGTTIFIDPGAGFGTGLHETTQLCLQALARRHKAGSPGRVLDFGSGSGILGIAAAVRGAAQVDAIEIDTRVHEAMRANARRNGVAGRLRVAAEPPSGGGPYDLVVANIVAPVLLEHAGELCARAGGRGDVVLSGLREEDVAEVTQRYATLVGADPEITALGAWRCLAFPRRA